MKTFMKKWKWKILILVYLCFIYGNSLTPAAISSKESGYFLAKIQDFLAGQSIWCAKPPILQNMQDWDFYWR